MLPQASAARSVSTTTGPGCCPRTSSPPCRTSTARPVRWQWSATASTTRPRSLPPRSEWGMGAAGTDAALQSADVALMADALARLPVAVTRARQAVRAMRQNVIASLAVKALFVVLPPLGFVTLVLAVAADMGMSLLVTRNGPRLLGGQHSADTAPSARAAGGARVRER